MSFQFEIIPNKHIAQYVCSKCVEKLLGKIRIINKDMIYGWQMKYESL